jgi:DNA-binding transcriptional regulator of glucitol operon
MKALRTTLEVLFVIAAVACPPLAWAQIRKADSTDDLREAWLG